VFSKEGIIFPARISIRDLEGKNQGTPDIRGSLQDSRSDLRTASELRRCFFFVRHLEQGITSTDANIVRGYVKPLPRGNTSPTSRPPPEVFCHFPNETLAKEE
jgi:hypothetical protein